MYVYIYIYRYLSIYIYTYIYSILCSYPYIYINIDTDIDIDIDIYAYIVYIVYRLDLYVLCIHCTYDTLYSICIYGVSTMYTVYYGLGTPRDSLRTT